MGKEKKSAVKVTIIVLAILLALSLVALAVILAGRYLSANSNSVVQVPDNIITDNSLVDSTSSEETSSSESSSTSSSTVSQKPSNNEQAVLLSLNSSIYGDNLPFKLDNMFPGDCITQYYCVRASFQDVITINFKTEITSTSKKLADALNISVKILGESEPLYKGTFSDMPTIEYKLSSAQAVTRDVYYIIDVYLPTSVGNEYQSRQLVADFIWSVEETENLKPAPPTGGDSGSSLPFVAIAVVSICGLIVLCLKKRKEVRDEQ